MPRPKRTNDIPQPPKRVRSKARRIPASVETPPARSTPSPDPVAPPAPSQPEPVDSILAIVAEAYRGKPTAFVRDMLGAEPDKWQSEVMEAVAAGQRRISIRSGHNVGKTTVVAWLAIWQAVCFFPQKAILTSPSASQMEDALLPELKSWFGKLPPPLRDLFEILADRIFLKASPNDSFISARTASADRPEALAGIHSDRVLLICDEASGVPEKIFEAAAGSMASFNATMVLISNPTRNSGLFFDTHHSLKDNWHTWHVSSLGNARVSPDFVKQVIDTYGEDSAAYSIRVLGEFPEREDDVLIAAELVDTAMARDVALDAAAPLVYGVDVARFGDDSTVICKRKGQVVVDIMSWRNADLMTTVGRIVAEAKVDSPEEICVDSIGLGSGVADRLRELGFNCRDVNVAEASPLDARANRLRDALWLQVRDFLAQRACRLPKHERLRQDLVSPTYGFHSNGRIVVESKDNMKRRKLPSTDFADALALTFAGESSLVGGRASSWVKGVPLRRPVPIPVV